MISDSQVGRFWGLNMTANSHENGVAEKEFRWCTFKSALLMHIQNCPGFACEWKLMQRGALSICYSSWWWEHKQSWTTPCVLELISNLKLQILKWCINSQNKYIMRHFTDEPIKMCMQNSRGCQHVTWNKNSSVDWPQRSWFCMGCLENQQCSARIKKSIVLTASV